MAVIAGHRGYKSSYPENTIRAFEEAVEAGCDVVETDLHISNDGYIVIAHDIDTVRVFGEKYDITKTDYVGTLENLLTLEEPRSKMPLFEELLEWCVDVNKRVSSQNRSVKLMLDIKTDNDPGHLYELIWKAFEKVAGIDYWKEKIIFGLWRPDFYIPEKLNDFSVIAITFDYTVAQKINAAIKSMGNGSKLSAVSMINFILYRETDLNELMKWVKEENLKVWFWTVNANEEYNKILKICQTDSGESLLEGIITDKPVDVVRKTKDVSSDFRSQFRWWIKIKLYGAFLFFFRRGYNVRSIFIVLRKIGFI